MSRKRILSKYDKRKYGWLHFALEVTAGIVACLILLSFVAGVARVDGLSMEPTLRNNQIVAFMRHADAYKQGDIIAIKMPSGDSYVKRVIAVGGEEIDIRNGKVYVNGDVITESYIQGNTDGGKQIYPMKIPENKVFVMGDNREESVDSRFFGAVSYTAIKGKLIGNK